MKFYMNLVNFSAKSVFSSSEITNGADRSKGFKNKAKSRGNPPRIHFSVQKSLLRKKSLLAAKVAKVQKVTFEPKSDISAPGDRKNIKETIARRHI